jgi:hypothetical protein
LDEVIKCAFVFRFYCWLLKPCGDKIIFISFDSPTSRNCFWNTLLHHLQLQNMLQLTWLRWVFHRGERRILSPSALVIRKLSPGLKATYALDAKLMCASFQLSVEHVV